MCVDGVTETARLRVFVSHMAQVIQARDPSLVGMPFFAEFDPGAVWLSDLRPAFADRFPFELESDDCERWDAGLFASAG